MSEIYFHFKYIPFAKLIRNRVPLVSRETKESV
jgi:hypothetical protein